MATVVVVDWIACWSGVSLNQRLWVVVVVVVVVLVVVVVVGVTVMLSPCRGERREKARNQPYT